MSSRDPIYRQIADHYRRKILSGELAPGTKLPTLREIMADRGVTKTTAGAAMAELRREGLTVARPRTGTVVAPQGSSNVADRVRAHALTGRALAGPETSRILEIGTLCAEDRIAVRMEIEAGSRVHVRRRLVSRDGRPVHVTDSYYPPFVVEAAPELLEPVSTGGSRELAAQRLGVAQGHALEEVGSRPASERERELLELASECATVTEVTRTVTLADGRVMEVAVKVTGGATLLRWSTSLGAH